MYLSPIQILQGYKIINRTLVKPVNPQRLNDLTQHAKGKISNEQHAIKMAKVAHYSERTRPIPQPKAVEQPSIHAADLTAVHESPKSTAAPDSPTDVIKQGANIDNCDKMINCVKEAIENKEKMLGLDEKKVEEDNDKLANSEVLHGQSIEIIDKISNAFRAPADGYFQLAPVGTFTHPTGIMQVLDNKSIDSMIANFKSAKSLNPDHSLLLDFDHQSQTGSTEAAGWINDLQKRDDGMYGKVAWSNSGREAIDGGKYRFVSPVWKRSDTEIVNGDAKYLRPLRFDSAGLTNDANLPVHALTSISNSQAVS